VEVGPLASVLSVVGAPRTVVCPPASASGGNPGGSRGAGSGAGMGAAPGASSYRKLSKSLVGRGKAAKGKTASSKQHVGR
jgi:hypothetical protein